MNAPNESLKQDDPEPVKQQNSDRLRQQNVSAESTSTTTQNTGSTSIEPLKVEASLRQRRMDADLRFFSMRRELIFEASTRDKDPIVVKPAESLLKTAPQKVEQPSTQAAP